MHPFGELSTHRRRLGEALRAFARLRAVALHGLEADALLRRIRESLLRAQSER